MYDDIMKKAETAAGGRGGEVKLWRASAVEK